MLCVVGAEGDHFVVVHLLSYLALAARFIHAAVLVDRSLELNVPEG
jgi:hypothetical protein